MAGLALTPEKQQAVALCRNLLDPVQSPHKALGLEEGQADPAEALALRAKAGKVLVFRALGLPAEDGNNPTQSEVDAALNGLDPKERSILRAGLKKLHELETSLKKPTAGSMSAGDGNFSAENFGNFLRSQEALVDSIDSNLRPSPKAGEDPELDERSNPTRFKKCLTWLADGVRKEWLAKTTLGGLAAGGVVLGLNSQSVIEQTPVLSQLLGQFVANHAALFSTVGVPIFTSAMWRIGELYVCWAISRRIDLALHAIQSEGHSWDRQRYEIRKIMRDYGRYVKSTATTDLFEALVDKAYPGAREAEHMRARAEKREPSAKILGAEMEDEERYQGYRHVPFKYEHLEGGALVAKIEEMVNAPATDKVGDEERLTHAYYNRLNIFAKDPKKDLSRGMNTLMRFYRDAALGQHQKGNYGKQERDTGALSNSRQLTEFLEDQKRKFSRELYQYENLGLHTTGRVLAWGSLAGAGAVILTAIFG